MEQAIDVQSKEFTKYLEEIKSAFKAVFSKRNSKEENLHRRGFTKEELDGIMSVQPLSVAIPTEYGGRGIKVNECLSLLEAASYESLPLSLIFGINFALFLEPFAKYAPTENKRSVYNSFLYDQAMGGLMISEPDYGSDALSMRTSYTKEDDKYKIKGLKHWQGLTGMANFWLVAARAKKADGSLGRDIDMFFTNNSLPEQEILVKEYYKNNGLYPIPYGINEIDIEIPETSRLIPESTGIKLLMDTLHRSRLQFPGMAMGFLKRIMEEAMQQCKNRLVRGSSLLELDQVKLQLSKIQSAFTICSAMCHHSSKMSGIEEDLSGAGIEANAIKAYVTDLMQNASQTLTQLMGSAGYRIQNLGSRGIMDSRPFQIFEGPNGMLYSQISEMIIKKMHRAKQMNVYEFLKDFELSKLSIDRLKEHLNFTVERNIAQRKHVNLGQIFAKIIVSDYVITLGKSGFQNDLIKNAIATIEYEISDLVNAFHNTNVMAPVESFALDSNWKDYV